MKIEIKVPAMGESITEATVGNILKASGSQVEVDEEILELETDKVNQVLYAPKSGKVELLVKQDDVVKIDQIIGYVDTEAKGEAEAKKPKEETSKEEKPVPKKEEAPASKAVASARESREDYVADLKKEETPKKEAPPPKKEQPAPVAAAPLKGAREETPRRMSKIRKVIAKRLIEAQQTTAMLTTFNEVDLTEIIELRQRDQETFTKKHGVKLGFMSFFVKATVSALQAFPQLNSYIKGEDIIHREYYDIGVAVGTDRGLVVPVIRDCDRLTFAQIEMKLADFARKAREGGLSADDLQGGGFTITNGGVYGSLLSTPILNLPQCGILGMHKIMKRAVVIDDQIVIRSMMYLAMSYDHRIIDGKEAVSFLVHIKSMLEDPARLLLDF